MREREFSGVLPAGVSFLSTWIWHGAVPHHSLGILHVISQEKSRLLQAALEPWRSLECTGKDSIHKEPIQLC